MVELGDAREVMGVMPRKGLDGQVAIVTLDDKGTFKCFDGVNGKFRLGRHVNTQQVVRVCSKVTHDLDKPSFMVCFKDANYPLLLSFN